MKIYFRGQTVVESLQRIRDNGIPLIYDRHSSKRTIAMLRMMGVPGDLRLAVTVRERDLTMIKMLSTSEVWVAEPYFNHPERVS